MNEPLTEMDAILAAAALKNNPVVQPTEPIVSPVEPVIVTPTETITPPVETVIAQPTEPIVPPVEPVIVTPTEPIIPEVLSFEQELEKRSGGKFKSIEDVDKVINAPKEKFANEEIRRFNELAEKGVKLDKEFFELQSIDFNAETDPIEMILQAIKRKPEGNGLSESTIEYTIAKKYNINEWIDKDPEDFTQEDLANQQLLIRDAEQDRAWLNKYKEDRVISNVPSPEEIEQTASQKRATQEQWTSFVQNDLVSKITEISIPVEHDKDGKITRTFDYKLSEADRTDTGNTMKLITEDVGVLFNRFGLKDDQGKVLTNPDGSVKIDHQRFYKMLLTEKALPQMLKNVWSDAKAEGIAEEIKRNKNINFEQNAGASQSDGEPKTEMEAIQRAFAKKNGK